MKEKGPWESMERLHKDATKLALKEPLNEARNIFGLAGLQNDETGTRGQLEEQLTAIPARPRDSMTVRMDCHRNPHIFVHNNMGVKQAEPTPSLLRWFCSAGKAAQRTRGRV